MDRQGNQTIRSLLGVALAGLIILACTPPESGPETPAATLEIIPTNEAVETPRELGLNNLVNWMTGSFASSNQAARDTNFLDIRLEMWPVWQEADDGYWLYVEQAVAGYTDKPYRQRMYHVTEGPQNTFISEVFLLPEPETFIGGYKNTALFEKLTPDMLTLRAGCAITLTYSMETFTGATQEGTCSSDLRGAAYATSIVTINSDRLVSWDRGFNESGEQVWGATTGGYIFEKETPK